MKQSTPCVGKDPCVGSDEESVSDQVGVCRRDEEDEDLVYKQATAINEQIPACVADAGMCCR